MEKLPHRARSLQGRGLVDVFRDRLQTRQDDQGVVADETPRRQRRDRDLDTPFSLKPRNLARSDHVEQRVRQAKVTGENRAEQDTHRHHRGHVRQQIRHPVGVGETRGAVEGQSDEGGQGEARHGGHHPQDQGVAEGLPEQFVRQKVFEVLQTDDLKITQATPVRHRDECGEQDGSSREKRE